MFYPNAQALLYQGGRAALGARDYSRAVERLEAALARDPSATVIHYPLAMAYRGLGDLDQARDHLGRGGSRTGAGYAAGAAVPMADPLMAAVTTALRSPQTHRDLGLQATAREDWPEAVRQFRSAAEMAPDNAVMRLNLGTALIRTGAARDALAALEAALKIDPRLAAAHYLLGTLLERAGRDAEAIERFGSAATYDETLDAARLRLADALRRNGRFEEALVHYGQIGEGDQARFGEVMAFVRLGRYGEARARLSAAMARHPEQPGFVHALARVLATAPDDQVRDGRRALELVQALAAEYQTASVAETMAMALAELGRFAEAVEWQRFAMAIVSDAGAVRRGPGDGREPHALSARRALPHAVAGRRAGAQSRSGGCRSGCCWTLPGPDPDAREGSPRDRGSPRGGAATRRPQDLRRGTVRRVAAPRRLEAVRRRGG